MVASLNGIIFSQIYGDNSGGAEFDTDGDGTATQEDEFVSLANTTGAPVDLSGWQIWSDMSGSGAPDGPQDGLYHTFPPGTVLGAGKTLHIVNEYTGTPPPNIQEASEGGLESGAGGINTNFLTEGDGDAFASEGVALVNPATGEYIIINLAGSTATNIPSQSGFPGTTSLGETNAADEAVQEDQNAGSSYQYNAATDSYDYGTVFVACFAAGTRVTLPRGTAAIETLKPGDLVETLDHGPQPVRMVLRRSLRFAPGAGVRNKPVEIAPNALGPGTPDQRLIVSPQHRMLVQTPQGDQRLAPAKGLTDRKGVRIMQGRKQVTYVHLVFDQHEIIHTHSCWSESFYPGATALSGLAPKALSELADLFPQLRRGEPLPSARPLMRVRQTRTLQTHATGAPLIPSCATSGKTAGLLARIDPAPRPAPQIAAP